MPEWGQQVWVHNTSGTKLDTVEPQARWAGYDANIIHAHHIHWSVKKFITVERDVKFISPTIIVNTLPPTQLPVHNDTSTCSACSPTSCSTLSRTTVLRYKHMRQALQVLRLRCLNHPRVSLFPQMHLQVLHTLRLSCKPVKSANESKTNRLSPRVVFQSLQRWSFRSAPFRTYYVRSTRILLATSTTTHVIATSIPKYRA